MEEVKDAVIGEVYRIAGPVATAIGAIDVSGKGIRPRIYDLIQIGHQKLIGEVIGIKGEQLIIQVYEDTSGVKPGDPVINTGEPLTVELGPGLLTSIYDGIQRPLPVIKEKRGDFIERGVFAPALDRKKKWEFKPTVKRGDKVDGGTVIGTTQEMQNVEHKIMMPPKTSGVVKEIYEGEFTIDEPICILEDDAEITMMQKWPVRVPRPFKKKLMPNVPLITGQRILDTLFPVAKGGTAVIPGGFGTGKTVCQHQLSKWSDAKIIVYVGCGERGNEMCEVLTEFPKLEDPWTGRPLMERSILIANTSNMPVAAREASVYTGITIAEYYRDMGYDVSLMADSTSRWAEAMREISSRLEEMPGEEGFPAYLAAKLSAFYERAGRVTTLNGEEGSITVIGAVSPPGGDFSEPVTQNTLRIAKVFWALDTPLAQRRHFPAINWLTSYSLYSSVLKKWLDDNIGADFSSLKEWSMKILQKEAKLQEIVQLVGSDALPEDEQLTLEMARMIREFFLQQNAYHEVDTYCSMDKQYKLLKAIRTFASYADKALKTEMSVEKIISVKSRDLLARIKFERNFDEELNKTLQVMEEDFKDVI